MAIRFIARHMVGGTGHEHIASLRWVQEGSSQTESSTREDLVTWIRDKDGRGYVDINGTKAWVEVVSAVPPYLRTREDGVWTDNLLALPTN